MRVARFATAAAWLTAFGLGGVALADAITSPVSQALDPSFDIRSTEVLADGDSLRFRMTVRGNAGASLPPRAAGEIYAYIWPTSADAAAVGFPRGQGPLALALVSHPDHVETMGGVSYSAQWHPHWVVLEHSKGCGPYGLKVMDAVPGAPGPLPQLSRLAAFPASVNGPAVEVRIPARLLGDPARLRFDGMTASLVMAGADPAPVMCVRPFDVASGRLTLQGTVTRTGG